MLSVTLIVKGAFTCLAASATATILYAGEQPDTLSAFDIGGIYSEELIRVGINESGGEFGSGILPGVRGKLRFHQSGELCGPPPTPSRIVSGSEAVTDGNTQATVAQFRTDGANLFRVSFLMAELVPPSPARPTWADRLGFQNVCARRRPGWGLPSMRPCVPSERSAPCAAL